MGIRRLVLRALPILACAASLGGAQELQGAAPRPFTLEPGDVVKVVVWREKDLGCECKIDETGRLTLPLIGVVRASGRPWDSLRDSLLSQYQGQLRNPSVTLTPLRRVLVLGEVTKPGAYLADPTLSLAGLVALAGGASSNGDLRRVRVVRNGQTVVKSSSIETLMLEGGVHSNDQIFVDRRPWLERNGAFISSALISIASIAVVLIHR